MIRSTEGNRRERAELVVDRGDGDSAARRRRSGRLSALAAERTDFRQSRRHGGHLRILAFALILREAAELDRLARKCLDAGFICRPDPSAFARYALYASIGLVEVVILFSWSLRVEQQMRDRDYAPEWRSR